MATVSMVTVSVCYSLFVFLHVTIHFFLLCSNVNEKVSILQNLTLAIADQLALYGSKGMSGSKSPSMSTISSTGTGTTYQDSPMKNRLISRLTNKSDSVDSEYELTLL